MNKFLSYLESAFLAGVIIGFGLLFVGVDIPLLLNSSLGGLGVVFFLCAYRPLNIHTEENEPMGFNELLGLSIVPKVLWISTAIATIAVLFYMLDLGNDGYLKMLYIGGLAIAVASVIMVVLKVMGTKHMDAAMPVLLRALPVLLIAGYIISLNG